MPYPLNYIHDLAKTIIASQLSTLPAWRGAMPSDPQLIDIAERMLAAPETVHRKMASDAILVAHSVHRHLMPKMLTIVERAWHASQSSDNRFTDAEFRRMSEEMIAEVLQEQPRSGS